MSLSQKVAGGTVWLAASRMGGQVFGLASTIIVARFLLPDDYGVFAAAMSLLVLVSVFAELPVGQAIIQLRTLEHDDYDTAFTISLLRGLIVAALLIALAVPLASFMRDPRIAPVTAALALYVFILGVRNPRLESFARDLDFSREAAVELGSKFVAFAAAAGFVIALGSYWALVWGMTAGALAQAILSYAFRPSMPRLTLKSFRRLFGYSAWMAGTSILGRLYQLVDTLSLGRISGGTALGVYSIGTLLTTRVTDVIAMPASRSLFAAFSQIQADRERVQRAFLSSMALMAALVVPVVIVLTWFAEPVVLVLLGPQWSGAVIAVQWLAAIIISTIVFTPMQAMLMGLGHMRLLFLRSLAFVVLYLPVAVLAVMNGGLDGLLAVKCAMIGALTLADCLIVRKVLGLGFAAQGRTVMRPVMAGSVMALVFLLLGRLVPAGDAVFGVGLPLAAVCATGGLAYLAVLLGLWHLAGRPDGIEAKVLGLAGTALAMVRLRSS